MVNKNYFLANELILIDRFPSGETHAQWERLMTGVTIEYHARNWSDIMNLILLDRTAKAAKADVQWFMPFMPFARHDRRRTFHDCNDLHLAMEMLKGIRVCVADPHSYVSEVMPYIPQRDCVNGLMGTGGFDVDVVCIPDHGATKKAHEWFINTGAEWIVQGSKVRDPKTGDLSGFSIDDPHRVKGSRVMIYDDICDGGATFIGLADVLRKHGAAQINLGVTHGLFTNPWPPNTTHPVAARHPS